MTITAQTAKSGPYNGNGSTTVFSYAFKVADEADLVVTVLSADGGTETVKTLTTDYTVSGVGNAGGGSITMLVAPVTGEKLTITRSVDLDQEVDLQNRGSVNPQTLEDSLDKLTQIAQDQQQQLDRSLKVDLFETADLVALTTNVNALAAIEGDISTVAGISSDVTAVAGDAADIGTVAGISSEVGTVAGISSDVTAVAADATDIGTVAGSIADVSTVAGISADVTTVAGISSDVTAVAAVDTEVGTVAGISSDVTAVAADAADIGTVAGISADVSTLAGISSDVTTAATNVADITNFADVYLGPKASDPATRNDGSALQAGDIYFNTTSDQMFVYDGATWLAIYPISTDVDINGGTIDGTVIGGSTPAAISGTTITATGDVDVADKIIHSGDTNTSIRFPAADTVTVETAGSERVRVDSSGNVGIGTSGPQAKLHISNDQGGGFGRILFDANVTSGYDTRIDVTDVGLELTAQSNSRGFAFNTGTTPTEKMRIDASGNVGIGTSSPAQALDVSGTVKATAFEGDGSQLTNISAGGAFTFLSSADASGDATIDFTSFDDTKYDAYLVILSNIVPATDGGILYLRTSTDGGSSFDSGASDYGWNYYGTADGGTGIGNTSDASDTEIRVGVTLGSAAGETGASAQLFIYGPHLAADTIISWHGRMKHSNGVWYFTTGSGVRKSAADVDAIRFFMSTGNIESGTITLYGLGNS